ncbi:MAG: hypothetical protein AB7V47_10365 [Phycisphaerales bacterium]
MNRCLDKSSIRPNLHENGVGSIEWPERERDINDRFAPGRDQFPVNRGEHTPARCLDPQNREGIVGVGVLKHHARSAFAADDALAAKLYC